MDKKINVAIVGLGFGAEFIPIYQNHPHANMYAICQRTKSRLDQIGDAFGVAVRYTDFNELLKDPNIDAVHINTPIADHAPMTLAALKAGKHVACTVPMATTVEECRQIVEAQKASGKKYMMMETTIYSREFFYVKELYTSGKMGRIQFLRATHQQEMLGWPGYWEGFPPMLYATHVVSPCLALVGKDAESVVCFGSGRIQEHLIPKYNSPFAIETAHIKLRDSDLVAEVMRSLFNTARQYRESFDVYGSKMSFEWPLIEHTPPVVHIGEVPHQVDVLDYAHLLPEPIQRFTTKGVYGGEQQHLSFIQGSGHGGSHPHLAHEFIMSIVEDREPFPNARKAANWTCTGILAHESAMRGGERMYLPEFTFSD
ncbi:MAG: Gfo/Idh/MocA family oxidoreductase [Anaerolineae bacterium]|nr:Gfo/Idh/MocA family oxidoreductase [Anaerolineae bacterium]MDW8070201.1 Gfo/Idh/MocA family oxidoreductase [Anaerolineae bacterium]